MEQLLLKVEEVAQLLRIGRSKAYALVVAGDLPSVRVGGQVRIPCEALKDWVRSKHDLTTAPRLDRVVQSQEE